MGGGAQHPEHPPNLVEWGSWRHKGGVLPWGWCRDRDEDTQVLHPSIPIARGLGMGRWRGLQLGGCKKRGVIGGTAGGEGV